MSNHSPESGEPQPSARVLPFRPRKSETLTPPSSSNEPEAAPDDYRHRMIVNMAGLGFALLLTASGIWLASRISDMRNTQDCVLSGRRNCAPVAEAGGSILPARQH